MNTVVRVLTGLMSGYAAGEMFRHLQVMLGWKNQGIKLMVAKDRLLAGQEKCDKSGPCDKLVSFSLAHRSERGSIEPGELCLLSGTRPNIERTVSYVFVFGSTEKNAGSVLEFCPWCGASFKDVFSNYADKLALQNSKGLVKELAK